MRCCCQVPDPAPRVQIPNKEERGIVASGGTRREIHRKGFVSERQIRPKGKTGFQPGRIVTEGRRRNLFAVGVPEKRTDTAWCLSGKPNFPGGGFRRHDGQTPFVERRIRFGKSSCSNVTDRGSLLAISENGVPKSKARSTEATAPMATPQLPFSIFTKVDKLMPQRSASSVWGRRRLSRATFILLPSTDKDSSTATDGLI